MNLKIHWLLKDCQTQRRYLREGNQLMLPGEPSANYWLKKFQRELAQIRAARH